MKFKKFGKGFVEKAKKGLINESKEIFLTSCEHCPNCEAGRECSSPKSLANKNFADKICHCGNGEYSSFCYC